MLHDAPVLYSPVLSQNAQSYITAVIQAGCVKMHAQWKKVGFPLTPRFSESQRDKLLSALSLFVYFHYEKWAGGMHSFQSRGRRAQP